MRLQDFGSSTQEGEFAVMLSDRALGIMEIKSQVNQDEMSSSNSSNSDNTSSQFLRAVGKRQPEIHPSSKATFTLFSAFFAKISNCPITKVAILFRTYSNFDVIYRRLSAKSHH